MKRKSKVGFVSLGCSKNLMDTEVMLHHLADAGYEITPEETEADVVIINTCGFIESAKRESIDSILDIAWLKEHHTLKGLVVTGCLAERYGDELKKEMPEIDAILGVGSIHSIVEAVDTVLAGGRDYARFDPKESCALGGDRVVTTGGAMAYLKIAEGCNNRCTYCAIPAIRGNMRSREMEDIIAEAKDLESMGVKEVCLIAQDTSAYGSDLYGAPSLDVLLREILAETNIPWIRLLYCYPDKITDELIQVMKENDRVVKYIDIPIQHISDSVLARMNRHGDGAMIRDAIARLRAAMPNITLRTTAMVGFPGETEEDFDELCRFVRETKFRRFGAFTYSREEGTASYDMEDQIDEKTAGRRYDILMKQQVEISAELNEAMVGKTVKVLCEGFDEVSEAYFGRSEADAPDIDGKVYFTAPRPVSEGEFVSVKITEAMDYDLIGEVLI